MYRFGPRSTKIGIHLINRVHSLHNLVLQKLEVAELDRIVGAVVLQILVAHGLDEDPSDAGNGVTIHVRDPAVARDRIVARGSANESVLMGHSRPLFLYFHPFITVDTNCSI